MIYFRGCVIRERLNNISEAIELILNKLGVDYRILKDEGCCGSFLLRTGFQDEAVDVMMKNLDKLKDEKILVSCSGCYRTLKNDYTKILGTKLDVVHVSQFFNNLIEEGDLKFKKTNEKVTYHDPCHLGRHSGEYDAPRNLLSKIVDLVEMERNREKSRCCGAGAGVKSAFPEIAQELSKKRIEDAKKSGVDIIATACPFCILNLKLECSDHERVLDLSEIIIMGLENE